MGARTAPKRSATSSRSSSPAPPPPMVVSAPIVGPPSAPNASHNPRSNPSVSSDARTTAGGHSLAKNALNVSTSCSCSTLSERSTAVRTYLPRPVSRRCVPPGIGVKVVCCQIREGGRVTKTETTDLYYDPYDVDIDADPYPVFRRLREEAPLYYNEPYDFFAVSRFDDVERGLVDAATYISGRGGILELIKANMEMPPGILIFEDPPTHTIHRGLLSRVFTPKQMNALEPRIRQFCVDSLDRARRRGPVRLRRRPRRADAHAGDRHAARDPRRRPGVDPRVLGRVVAHQARPTAAVLRGISRAASCSPSTSTGGPITRPTTS